ncbi:hypothetical protein PFISCL1PPCAC_29095 [Pristionchus fissidentatus]|uniref:Apple domain-containing protein n=1 Tax=Pristionchus fissidentatus TaxID=1538716 RepID=A0AAV5X4A9_9BILA|nr:hypothetical protein PFISCL1PPCAC_29095 [Pristionchus fissidentatus]
MEDRWARRAAGRWRRRDTEEWPRSRLMIPELRFPLESISGDVEKEKEEATGDKKEGGGKFKVGLPTGFSIDSGVGTMNKDGKATETAIDGIAVAPGGSTVAPEGTSAAPEGTSAAPEGTSVAPEGSTATAGDESSTESGAEVSSAAPEESTVASGESTSEPSSTVEGVSTGEEAATTAEPSEGASSTESATEVEPSTVAAEGSTTESSTDAGHGVIHPAKEFETSPLHPEESSTAKAEEGTTAEEGPAFVQATEDEEKEEAEKEEELITSDQKQREGLVEKALPTTPKTTETGTAAAKADKTTVASPEGTAEGADAEKTTVASSEGTVAPGESTTGAAESAEATTAAGEGAEGSTPSGAESTTGSSEDGAAAATTATPDVTTDLQHREGILEKALATASPTTKGEEGAEATTAASESSDLTTTSGSESTVAPTEEVVTSTEGTAATTEGNVGESTVSSKDGGKDVGGMAASIDETSKEEAKEVDEEMAKKGEVAQSGEKGASATSIDGFTTISPSESSTASFADETPTSTVPSPADLAKAIHREHGGAEFGQTGQRGSEETAGEEAAIKGEVKQSGEKGAAAASIDASSTAAPSEATTAADAASGEISTSSSVDGVGLAKGDNAESSTAGEISAESTSAPVETTSAEGAGTSEAVEESSTSLPSSIESFEASTSSSIDSSSTLSETTESSVEETGSTDHGLLIQKALATANPAATEKGLEVAPTTSVPSPADLAKAIHREHGGAEFGQTGQRGSEEAVTGAQEDEIKATTVSAAEATPAVTGESIDGGVDRALAAIGEQSKTTTEPPVQAVKDLLDALTSGDLDRTIIGKKVNGTEAGKLIKGTGAADGATPVNQKHDCSTGKLSFATFELVDLSTKFEVDAIAFSLPHCARLCYEVGCSMAAYSRFPRPLCLMHFETEDSHRCNAETNRTSYWTYASLQQVVAIDCIQCEGQTFFEHDHTVDITTLHAIDDSIVTVPSPQGISKNCEGGRLEFQFVPAGSLPRLNVTNDVPARTPADCARKCHEMKGCTTAGYIPTPSAEIANGVCLLTSDDEVCISKEDAVPQHASVTAFVISCIRCTRCSYTLSHMTLASSTAKFQHIATVTTIGECAEVCHGKKCTFAQYDATTNTCALSMEASLETGCNKVEPAVAVKGAYPVRLECVQCRD